jgi:hypothetical protein
MVKQRKLPQLQLARHDGCITGDRYLRSKGHAEQLGEMARCSQWIEYVPLQASTTIVHLDKMLIYKQRNRKDFVKRAHPVPESNGASGEHTSCDNRYATRQLERADVHTQCAQVVSGSKVL